MGDWTWTQWFSFVADIASVVGVVISGVAWLGVSRIRKTLKKELRAGAIKQRLQTEVRTMRHLLSSGDPLAFSEIQGSASRAVPNVAALDAFLEAPGDVITRTSTALSDLVKAPVQDFHRTNVAVKVLEELISTIETTTEEWSRSE
ncbi:MAG: hypothetical protein ACRELY_16980 [Polyangiaceae bacterium]